MMVLVVLPKRVHGCFNATPTHGSRLVQQISRSKSTHVKQVALYISFLFNTFYFNTWISSFDRWLILLTFTICTRRACRVDLYFQIGPRHKLTGETVKGHSPHMAQHGWIYHCRAARCMRQARAVPAYKTHPQLLIFAAVKKSAPYTRVFTVIKEK